MAMLLRRLTLLSLVGLLTSGAEDSRGRTTAAGSGETCEEKEETSHIQVRGSVGVRSNSSAVSTRQRARVQSTRMYSSGPDGPEYFQQGYGGIETWSWFTGVVAEDTVELAGAKAPAQRFGMIQMGNYPIGNAFPNFGLDATGSNALGPSSTDGIMGLLPGCLRPGTEACKDAHDATDVISPLYFTGAISEHAFTICLRDSEEGGGKLWVGKSSSPFPAGAVSVGLDFIPEPATATITYLSSYYKPAAPEGSPDIPVYLGGEQIYTVNKSGYNALFAGGLIDSGTAGFKIPPEVYKIFTEKIGEIMKADSEVAAVWDEAMENMSHGYMYCCATLSSEVAAKVKSLTPDFSFSVAGANLSVLGSSFLYQSTPCSGEYGISWVPDEGGQWVFGSSFFYGRTLRFDLTEKTGPNTAIGTLVMIPDDECMTDYGEYGEGTEVVGVPGQVIGPQGVIAAVVNLGEPPQPFLVQLDTGSQMILVYQHTCALEGITPNQGCVLVLGEDDTWLGAQPPQAPTGYSPPKCFDYMSTLLHDIAPDREFTEADLPLHAEVSIESMTRLIAKDLVPWMKCGDDRAVCGERRVFNTTSSTTLMPKNFPQPDFVHRVPDDGFFARAAPKLNCKPC